MVRSLTERGMPGRSSCHVFNADEYHRLAEIGIPGAIDRCEPIDGDLVGMAPIGHRHAGIVGARKAVVLPQNPAQLGRAIKQPLWARPASPSFGSSTSLGQ